MANSNYLHSYTNKPSTCHFLLYILCYLYQNIKYVSILYQDINKHENKFPMNEEKWIIEKINNSNVHVFMYLVVSG